MSKNQPIKPVYIRRMFNQSMFKKLITTIKVGLLKTKKLDDENPSKEFEKKKIEGKTK